MGFKFSIGVLLFHRMLMVLGFSQECLLLLSGSTPYGSKGMVVVPFGIDISWVRGVVRTLVNNVVSALTGSIILGSSGPIGG